MRGGLDDALAKLARRDELRRRTGAQPAEPGVPPALNELVEAVAGVLARHPDLLVTMGVEGAGAPVLLRFAVQDDHVQVHAEGPLAGARPVTEPATPTSGAPTSGAPEGPHSVPPAAARPYSAPPAPYPAPPDPPGQGAPPRPYSAPPAPPEPAAGPVSPAPDAPSKTSVDRAAMRLAALLREDPSLLDAPAD